MLTMAAAADPIENGAWSLGINTPPIDCLRGPWEPSVVRVLNQEAISRRSSHLGR